MSSGLIILLVALALFIGYLISRQNTVLKQSVQSLRKSAPRDLGLHEEEEIRALLKENRKIEAIKRCREITGYGLREAKDIVDSMQN